VLDSQWRDKQYWRRKIAITLVTTNIKFVIIYSVSKG